MIKMLGSDHMSNNMSLFTMLEQNPSAIERICEDSLNKFSIYEVAQMQAGATDLILDTKDTLLTLSKLQQSDLLPNQKNATTLEKMEHLNIEIKAYQARHRVNWVLLNGEKTADFNPSIQPLEQQIWALDRQKLQIAKKYIRSLSSRITGEAQFQEKQMLKLQIKSCVYQQMWLFLKMQEMDASQKLILIQQIKTFEKNLMPPRRIEIKRALLDERVDRLQLQKIDQESDLGKREQMMNAYLQEQQMWLKNEKDRTKIFRNYLLKLGEQALTNQKDPSNILLERQEKKQACFALESALNQLNEKNSNREQLLTQFNNERASYETLNNKVGVRGLIQQDYNESMVRSNQLDQKETTNLENISYEVVLDFPSEFLLSNFYQTYLYRISSTIDAATEAKSLIQRQNQQLYELQFNNQTNQIVAGKSMRA